jgi:hypothetical protein
MEKKPAAFVIGNAEYMNFPKLKMPAKDAHDIAEAFENHGFEVTVGINQTLPEILEMMNAAINRLKRDAPAIVVYYAGHGCVVDNKEYLIPTDGRDMANPAAAAHGFIGIEQITKMLHENRVTVNIPIILIFDCCRIVLGHGTRFVSNATDNRGPALGGQDIANIVILYSTVRTHVSAEDVDGSINAPFAENFLKHLPKIKDVGQLGKEVRRTLWESDPFWQMSVIFMVDNLLKPFSFEFNVVTSTSTSTLPPPPPQKRSVSNNNNN